MGVLKKATHVHLHMALVLVIALALARVGAAAAPLALPGCNETCGDVSIPYPFGVGNSNQTGDNCFLEDALELECGNNSYLHRRKGTLQIMNISLEGKIDLLFPVSEVCYDRSAGRISSIGKGYMLLSPAFAISSKDNKFISVGCDTLGYLNVYNGDESSLTGCLTRCDNISEVTEVQAMQSYGSCAGIGCCQVDIPYIPPGMRNISIETFAFENFNDTWSFNNCSYSFVVKNGNYNFSIDHLKGLPFKNNMTPFVVDWTVGSARNEMCQISKRGRNYACGRNSDCEDSDPPGYGYRCKCKQGYDGNPYLLDGCQDIKECDNIDTHNCINNDYCQEIEGSFNCNCPPRQSGNATRGGEGCHRKDALTKVIVGVGVGLVALFVGSSWLYLIYQKRKLIKQEENFNQQNGGIILQQQLSTREDSSQSTQIFRC